MYANAFHLISLEKQGLWVAWKWTAGPICIRTQPLRCRTGKANMMMDEPVRTQEWSWHNGGHIRFCPFPTCQYRGKASGGCNYCHTADSSQKKCTCNGGMAQHLLFVLVFSCTKYHITRNGGCLTIFQAYEHTIQAPQQKKVMWTSLNPTSSNAVCLNSGRACPYYMMHWILFQAITVNDGKLCWRRGKYFCVVVINCWRPPVKGTVFPQKKLLQSAKTDMFRSLLVTMELWCKYSWQVQEPYSLSLCKLHVWIARLSEYSALGSI